jgi:hypothetical protein
MTHGWLTRGNSDIGYVQRSSESFTVSERNRNPVAKCVEKIVFPLAVLVTDPKAFNLVHEVVLCPLLIGGCLIESVIRINVTGHRQRSFVLAHRGQLASMACACIPRRRDCCSKIVPEFLSSIIAPMRSYVLDTKKCNGCGALVGGGVSLCNLRGATTGSVLHTQIPNSK